MRLLRTLLNKVLLWRVPVLRAVLVCSLGVGLVVGLSACGPDGDQARRDEFSRRIQKSVATHVVPGLRNLVGSAGVLKDDVARYCSTGDPVAWENAKSSFGETVVAWAGVSHLRFGPLALKARAQSLSFWPDPRGIVWRQLRRVLAKKDTALLEPGTLAEQSVALQGLTALEILLVKPIAVGDGALPADTYKCGLATAIARNILATSQGALTGWTREGGWRGRMFVPRSNGNEVYVSFDEALAELVKSAMLGFQIIRDQQVVVLQDVLAGKTKLSRLAFHRSGLSKRYLRASIEGACELTDTLDLVAFVPDDKAWLRKWIPNACRILKDKSAKVDIPALGEDFPGELRAVDLRQLRFYSNGLRQVIGRDIAPAAGLTIGFNELDGD